MKPLQIVLASLTLAGLIFTSEHASANNMGKLAVSYTSHSSTDAGTTDKITRMVYDIGLYHKFQGGGGVLGALYQNEALSGNGSTNRTSYGISGGWMSPKDSGFFLIGTYFISSKYEEYTDGNGYQVDIGYKFSPGQVPIGLQFSYKHYDYSKFKHSDDYIDPYFALMVNF